jgi:hypothetical protein
MNNLNNGNGYTSGVTDNMAPVLEVARQVQIELRELIRQRTAVMRRIGTVKRTVASLAALFGTESLSPDLRDLMDGEMRVRRTGFTRAVRAILMEAEAVMSAREVCDRINERDPGMLARHKDPMASVTTVLNRLVAYGEAQRVLAGPHKCSWQWAAELGDTSIAKPASVDTASSQSVPNS